MTGAYNDKQCLSGPLGPCSGFPANCTTCPNHFPAGAELVRVVVVVTGNGGGLLRCFPLTIPREAWEDEPREYIEARGLVGTLDGSEGYEIMTPGEARDMAAKLEAAAGQEE